MINKSIPLVKGFITLLMTIITILAIGILKQEQVQASDGDLDIDSFSGLVISEDARNSIDEVKIDVTDREGRDRNNDVDITKLEWNGRSTRYQNTNDLRTSFYHHYATGENTGKILMEFPDSYAMNSLSDYVVHLTYPVVGYIENDSLERREIGANVTIDSIDKSTSLGPSLGMWESAPIIDVSTHTFLHLRNKLFLSFL